MVTIKNLIIMVMVVLMLTCSVAYADDTTIIENIEEAEVINELKSDNHNVITFNTPGDSRLKVNSQLQPMGTPLTVAPDYSGPVFRDHKFQEEILNFLLMKKGLKPFVVKEHGLFTRKSANSSSKSVSVKEYDEQEIVYVFRDIDELSKYVKNYSIVGYADTFSDGNETLMDCFDQAVIDTGVQGGNVLVLLRVDFIAALESSTIGLGTSGAAGFMKGSEQASVYGAALGYARSKAVPETDPYIFGMVLHAPDLPQNPIKIEKREQPVDRFSGEGN